METLKEILLLIPAEIKKAVVESISAGIGIISATLVALLVRKLEKGRLRKKGLLKDK